MAGGEGSKANVFSLSGRDCVLDEMESDPIVAAPTSVAGGGGDSRGSQYYYYEQLFRSHQCLLIDTATSEYLFLSEFFLCSGLEGYQQLFNDVFDKTLHFFIDDIEAYLGHCYDSVGLLFIECIIRRNQLRMQERQISCLEGYLRKMLRSVRPRLEHVLHLNAQSLERPDLAKSLMSGVAVSQKTNPHFVTRRYAEFGSSLNLVRLRRVEGGDSREGRTDLTAESTSSSLGGRRSHASLQTEDRNLEKLLGNLEVAIRRLLELMSQELPDKRQRTIFLINNHDLILSIFHEKALPLEVSAEFERVLRECTVSHVESQLTEWFGYLVDTVKKLEAKLAVYKQNGNAAPYQPNANEQAAIDTTIQRFRSEWKGVLGSLRSNAMSSFTNFTNGTEILKQILTQVVLYYTRFQQALQRLSPGAGKEALPTRAVLADIRNYSSTF